MDCIFCKIIKGDLGAEIVHEDDTFMAILDINPVTHGHVLVMPRAHHETFTDLPSELASQMAILTRTVARGVVRAMSAEGFNLLTNNQRCAGQAIPHVHTHIIPRRSDDAVRFNWDARPYPEGKMDRVANQIRTELGN